jgi:uncharacterized protein YbjQ (UPF0145 family)
VIITTTSHVEGKQVTAYLGLVAGEVIVGANIFKDLFASIRDVIGGRSAAYESTLTDARMEAIDELRERAEKLGANAVIGVSLDFEAIGASSSMLMVTAVGTAVKLG